ncbi:MAG: restriction endonuclease subunit S [Spirochaetaceae bacterium]|nr:restriction endonuclease subunit S [Spirochaetaceae bacterium]
MINVFSWQKFQLSDFFCFLRGKGITKEEMFENQGNIPCIQSGETNNGIIGYMDGSFINDKKHTFVSSPFLSVARSGTSGCVHVHTKDSYIGDSVYALKLTDRESIPIYLFLATLLNKERYRYRYGRKVSIEKYIKEYIRLPVNNDSKPDWNYMEAYINSLLDYSRIETKIEKKTLPLDITEWRQFKIDDLFTLSIAASSDLGSLERGNVPFIGRTENNNGLQAFVSVGKVNKGKCITVSMVGTFNALWQEHDFAASQNILVLRNGSLNVYRALFIVTIINIMIKNKYSYNRPIQKIKFINNTIALPVDKTGSPDWQFMENYIKALPYSDKINIGKKYAYNR